MKTVTGFPNVIANWGGCKPGISRKSVNITSELRAEPFLRIVGKGGTCDRIVVVGHVGIPPL